MEYYIFRYYKLKTTKNSLRKLHLTLAVRNLAQLTSELIEISKPQTWNKLSYQCQVLRIWMQPDPDLLGRIQILGYQN
jgi:hypothetical protein